MKKYKDNARVNVKAQGMIAEQVEALDYRGTAALCNVIIAANGNSPVDFCYEIIRRDLANEMRDAARTEKRKVQAALLQAAIDKNPDLAGLTVKDQDGKLEIA